MKLGFDIGSKTINHVLINNNKILNSGVSNHNGNILDTLNLIINEINSKFDKSKIKSYGITGSIEFEGLNIINPILASVEANKFIKQDYRNILSIGCETFYLIILDENLDYVEHSNNTECASGTGSFIDQQAERLGFTTAELALKASEYKGDVPSIAARCAVFAKTDIIHAQTQGYSKEAIACGICEGVARSVLSNIIKGRKLENNLLVIGGVSKNKKIISEIEKELNITTCVAGESSFFNAVGSAVLGNYKDLDLTMLSNKIKSNRETRDKLAIGLKDYPDFNADKKSIIDEVEITEYESLAKNEFNIYLGIDIGSTSTKTVIIDEDERILAGLYTKTKGDPVKAVSLLFEKIKIIFNNKKLNILGCGTTGSGRILVKEVLGADFAVNEISAHAKGAVFIDPDVDTIIEIGGQDSKFTILKNGEVVISVMNYVCAAGTGSFIEEQAKRLNITLDEISDLAMGMTAPFTSDRCTVYMERDLNIFLREGYSKEEIITAVLYSVKDNYLSKVVGKNNIGNKIFFQGATGRNKALVAIFENELSKPVFVSKFCHLTGALGVCLYLKEKGITKSKFRGVNFNYSMHSIICSLCSNKCELKVYNTGKKQTAWGLKCGRDFEDKKIGKKDKQSYLEKKYYEIFSDKNQVSEKKGTIGIPVSVYMIEYYILFKNLFEKLGYDVVLEKSSRTKLHLGAKLVNSDFCEPMVMIHGLVKSLLDKNVDYIFLPTIINNQNIFNKLNKEESFMNKICDAYFCYYSEYSSIIVDNLDMLDLKNKMISPKIKFNNRSLDTVAEEFADELSSCLKIDKNIISDIFKESYNYFSSLNKKLIEEGEKIINKKSNMKILLLGRPYSIFDSQINLNIPKTLESHGFDLIYQSMLDFTYDKKNEEAEYIDKMHWYYGQQIMLASEYAAAHENIYPVFLTCFRCSPDSYLITYFTEMMNNAGKPYLIIQLDDHASDVGYQTRIEAAIESFKNHYNKKIKKYSVLNRMKYKNDKITTDSTLLIPFLSPIISDLQEYSFNAYGYKAEVVPLNQKSINLGYKYASGGECMPNVAIIGSYIDYINKKKLDPSNLTVYLPTICYGCNFNQFTILMDFAFNNAGMKDIKIANPNSGRGPGGLIRDLNKILHSVSVLGSILYKLVFRITPYEKNKGDTENALQSSLNLIKKHIKEQKSLHDAAYEIRKIFEKIPSTDIKKPKIAVLGDLYVKYNSILNDDIYSLINEIGGEILIPSFTEYAVYMIDGDVRETGLTPRFLQRVVNFEREYEEIFKGILDDHFEPDVSECVELMHKFGIKHYIAGETTMSVSRLLYYIEHKLVNAVLHVNPVFCCPGVVTSSIFKKIQKEFNIPIVNIFYDGTNKPNKMIIPHLHYLNETLK